MSARLLNERLFIVARAEEESSEQKLLRAGASRVVSPYVIGGARMAQAVLRPNVVDFLEIATRTQHLELNIEETMLSPGSPLVAQTLEQSGMRAAPVRTDYRGDQEDQRANALQPAARHAAGRGRRADHARPPRGISTDSASRRRERRDSRKHKMAVEFRNFAGSTDYDSTPAGERL